MRRLVCLLAWLFLLSGCSPPTPPLRLVVNPWIGYDPFLLAREESQLEEGIKIVEVLSNSESQRVFANGLVEAAALTLDEALRLADRGVPLRIAAVLDVSMGADAVLARPDIQRLDQLKGRRIGVETGAVGALMLARLLEAAKLKADEVSILPIEVTQHVALLSDGRLDAVITFEPVRTQLLRQGFRVLFDSHALPNQIIDVLVIQPEVDARPLITAWQTGLDTLQKDPSAATAKLATGTDLSADEYRHALTGLRFLSHTESTQWLAGGAEALLVTQAQPIVTELIKAGLLQRPPDWPLLLAARKNQR